MSSCCIEDSYENIVKGCTLVRLLRFPQNKRNIGGSGRRVAIFPLILTIRLQSSVRSVRSLAFSASGRLSPWKCVS